MTRDRWGTTVSVLAEVLYGGDEIPEAGELHRIADWFVCMFTEPAPPPDPRALAGTMNEHQSSPEGDSR